MSMQNQTLRLHILVDHQMMNDRYFENAIKVNCMLRSALIYGVNELLFSLDSREVLEPLLLLGSLVQNVCTNSQKPSTPLVPKAAALRIRLCMLR